MASNSPRSKWCDRLAMCVLIRVDGTLAERGSRWSPLPGMFCAAKTFLIILCRAHPYNKFGRKFDFLK